MFRMDVTTNAWEESIFPNDPGSLAFNVAWADRHTLSYRQVWHNCGEVAEHLECSCGFSTTRTPGRGCWQWGHNVPSEFGLDDLHARILLAGIDIFRGQTVLGGPGCSAEWDGLSYPAIKELGKMWKAKKAGHSILKEVF